MHGLGFFTCSEICSHESESTKLDYKYIMRIFLRKQLMSFKHIQIIFNSASLTFITKVEQINENKK